MARNPTAPIRDAIASGEFRKAHHLWNEYMAQLHQEFRSGALTHAQFEEARELTQWARLAVLCARAHIQHQLNRLQTARAYGAPVSRETPRVVETRF